MRLSQGVLCGRRIELYNPEFFEEHEEVIIFSREEFRRMYQSMAVQINHLHRLDMGLDRGEGWKLMGFWPKFMECIPILNLNLGGVFNNKPLQTYLDSYIYDDTDIIEKTAINSLNEILTLESLLVSWSK